MCVYVCITTLDYANLRVIQAVKTLVEVSFMSVAFQGNACNANREGYRIIIIRIYMYYVNISCTYTSILRDFLARAFNDVESYLIPKSLRKRGDKD